MKKYALYFAWVIALLGFLISFFFEEILGKEPCPLCWYQRIGLFPLVILLGIAAYREDRKIVTYALPLALLGLAVAVFQIFVQTFPEWMGGSICGQGTGCSSPGFVFLNVITFPMVSALGFLCISFFLLLARKNPS